MSEIITRKGKSASKKNTEKSQNLPHAIIIDKKQGYIYLSSLLWYIERKVPAEKRDEVARLIKDNLSRIDGEELMQTIADTYIEQGMQQGMQQRNLEIAKMMLQFGDSSEKISKMTGLSLKQIKSLENK